MSANIRKLVVQVDETRKEMGQAIDPPTRRAVAIAVIENPYAGRYSQSLDDLIAIGEELGALLGQKAVAALGIEPGQAQSYGKAAIVGEAGELEHAAAILHPKLGAPLRVAVEKGAALVPSAKKRGTLGTAPGVWGTTIGCVNTLIADLAYPLSETSRVLGAPAGSVAYEPSGVV